MQRVARDDGFHLESLIVPSQGPQYIQYSQYVFNIFNTQYSILNTDFFNIDFFQYEVILSIEYRIQHCPQRLASGGLLHLSDIENGDTCFAVRFDSKATFDIAGVLEINPNENNIGKTRCHSIRVAGVEELV